MTPNAHKPPKQCECGQCGGLQTQDYYLVLGQIIAKECYETKVRKQQWTEAGKRPEKR